MKVAFLSPLPLSLAFGGLEVQILETARALQRLCVQVKFFDPWSPAFDADLLHCFGSEYQLGELVVRAQSKGVPVVVSAVFTPRSPRYTYLAWRSLDSLVPVKTTFGLRRRILRLAHRVIAISHAEARDLTEFFGVPRSRIEVIPNGVRRPSSPVTSDQFVRRFNLEDFVLYVASVERRKNQLRLLRALHGSGVPIVLIGHGRPDESDYVRLVERAVERSRDVLWIPGLPPESDILWSAYMAARVHVVASLSEGQPLASLEAAAAGANLVMSNLPCLRELFGNCAWYCNPLSPRSIRQAVLAAWRAPRGTRYIGSPPPLLSWDEVARRILDVYHAVLAQTRGAG